jgi:hypothetical protein
VIAAIIHPDTLHSFEGSDVSSIHTDTAVLANEAEFQDVSEGDMAEMLESHPLPLMNEELAKQTCKEV